jgi:hypothetical protein
MGGDVPVRDEGGVFEVAIGDVPCGVVVGGDATLHVGGECGAPEDGRLVVSEEDTSHAGLAGVSCAQHHGLVGDDLAELSGPSRHVLDEPLELVEAVADRARDADAAGGAMREGELERAE